MPADSLLATMPPLLLTPRQAAKALAICEKTLWSLTKRGELPVVWIGRAKRYSVDVLRVFASGGR